MQVNPRLQPLETLGVGWVEPAVGPLVEQGLDESFGFAVGLRPVRPGPPVASTDGVDRGGIGRLGVGPGVVGQDRSIRTPWPANQTAASSSAWLALRALSSGTWATYASRVWSSMTTSKWS
jgi:hypothetical protein